jgi:predicted Abi (CAAX) family protease
MSRSDGLALLGASALLGSNPVLLRGKSGVRGYFAKTLALPVQRQSAEFSDTVVECAGLDAINIAGVVTFQLDESAVPLRIMLNLVRKTGAGTLPATTSRAFSNRLWN